MPLKSGLPSAVRGTCAASVPVMKAATADTKSASLNFFRISAISLHVGRTQLKYSAHDRSDDSPLPNYREAGQRRYGSRLQGRGPETAAIRCGQISTGRRDVEPRVAREISAGGP